MDANLTPQRFHNHGTESMLCTCARYCRIDLRMLRDGSHTFFPTQTQEKASFDQVLNLESGTLPHVSEAQYVILTV